MFSISVSSLVSTLSYLIAQSPLSSWNTCVCLVENERLLFQMSDLRDTQCCYIFEFYHIYGTVILKFFVSILSISTAQLSSQKCVSHRPYFLMPLEVKFFFYWVILQPFQFVSFDTSPPIEKTVSSASREHRCEIYTHCNLFLIPVPSPPTLTKVLDI